MQRTASCGATCCSLIPKQHLIGETGPMGLSLRHVLRQRLITTACVLMIGGLLAQPVLADGPQLGPDAGQLYPVTRPNLPSVESVWSRGPMRGAPRGESPIEPALLLYDNGMPLDDQGFDNSAQFSLAADGASGSFRFIAAIADDFTLEDPFNPFLNGRVTTVRMATSFFGTGGDPDPSPIGTWESVYVVVFNNSPFDVPDGQPSFDPTNPLSTVAFLGDPVALQVVPAGQLTETAVDSSCNGRFVVDIPVDFTLEKNRIYWLAVIPRFAGPPQSVWNLSEESNGFVAHFGFPSLNFEFWTVTNGNAQNVDCPNAPPPFSQRDLSFQLFGEDVAPTEVACCDLFNDECTDVDSVEACFAINPFTIAAVNAQCADIVCPEVLGACCDDNTGICTDNINLFDCFALGARFDANATCATLDPPCGTTDIGACCQDEGVCTEATPTECSMLAGLWLAGDCATAICPPPNDLCQDAIVIGPDAIIPFSNINANSDGPLDSPGGVCTNINQDVWFRYVAPCTGTATIATCVATDFDSAIQVYDGCFCGDQLGPVLTCDNDSGCVGGGDDAQVQFEVQEGECYLVRVGGAGMAQGDGTLIVGCVPADLGACCNPAGFCEVVNEIDCMAAGGTFFANEPCSPITCPMPDNDECDQALTLSSGFTNFDTTLATTGTDDQPGSPCIEVNNDLWFRYTAECDGELTVSLCGGTSFDASLAIYSDDCMAGPLCPIMGEPLACDDDGCGVPGGPSELSLSVLAGECFLIRVGGVADAVGTGTIFVDCVPDGFGACCDALDGCEVRAEADCMDTGDLFFAGRPCDLVSCDAPANDECPNAIAITNGVFDFTTLRATTDGPMVDPMMMNCLPAERDIWYEYTATCDGMLVISPCLDSDFDANVVVYDGCICPNDAMTQIACTSGDIDAGCDPMDNQNRIELPVVSGACYLIRVGAMTDTVGSGRLIVGCLGMDEGACCLGGGNCVIDTEMDCLMAGGDFTLGEPCSPLTCPPVANDECDNAVAISLDTPVAFDTTDATSDGPDDSPGAPCALSIDNDVWYTVTANCNGQLLVSLCDNTTFDAALAVYALQACPPMGGPLACDDDGCGPGGPAELALQVMAGEEYLIRVGGANGAVGMGELIVTCAPTDTCCPGDADDDGDLTLADIDALSMLLLMPPDPMDDIFCQADANQDMLVDSRDIAALVDLLLMDAECPIGPVDLTGACCAFDGSCRIETQLDCINAGDTYLGNNVSCMPNMCPPPPDPPANDLCINAIALTCNSSVVIDNTTATTTSDEPAFSCRFNGPDQGVGTVWYTFVAEADSALISTCNTAAPVNDTLVAVYEGTMCPTDPMQEIACVEDAGGACGRLAQVCVDGLTVGQTYTVQIASFDESSRGAITVDLMCPCPTGACCFVDSACQELRANDCTNAGGAYQGDGVSCATDPCPPPPILLCCQGDLNLDGFVTLDDIDPFVTAMLADTELGIVVTCIADINEDKKVDGNDIPGFVSLIVDMAVCPDVVNDDCSSAMQLSCGDRVIMDNTNATTAGDDPEFSCRAGGPAQGVGTLWFSFTAEDTTARVATCGSIPPAVDTILAVYDSAGCPVSMGDEIGCSEDVGLPCGARLSEVCVSGLMVGQDYLVQVASFDEVSRGFISVEVECPCP